MRKRERLFLVNRLCDKFEAQLLAGKDCRCIDFWNAACMDSDDPKFLDELMAELIALKLEHSRDRKAAVEMIQVEFPDQRERIEQILSEISDFRKR